MHSFTTLGEGHGSPCLPATQEKWQEARNDQRLVRLCQQILDTTDADEQKRLKGTMPVWTPRCGEFKNNHRAECDAIAPLNRLMFDIDQKGYTDHILGRMVKNAEGEYIGQFLILLVEESVRHGTHVLVAQPAEMDANEAQNAFSELIGLPVDPAVKNIAGCIYLVPQDHVRYQSPKFFDVDELPPTSNPSSFILHPSSEDALHPSSENPSSEDILHPSSDYPSDYDGIPYPILVDSLAEQLGGLPVHGSRNTFLFSMACHLRYVCNDDPEWIRQVLPTYGEDPKRVFTTIQSACHRAQMRSMPQIVSRAISIAAAKAQAEMVKAGLEEPSNVYCLPFPPEMPVRLPKLIRLLVSKVHPMYRPAVAMQVFPALGAHLHGVRTRYVDNVEDDLGCFMGILAAKQSIGKGCVNMPIESIMEDIKDRDKYNRDIEKDWKENRSAAGDSKKKQKRPEGLCIQYLSSNLTNAALVLRLIDAEAAGNKRLFLKLDEIELLDQIKASGGASASDLIRLDFNHATYGQERVGVDSITGTPPLRLNFTASTTIPSCQEYFKGGLTDGTISRLTFATITKPSGMRGIPKYGTYDDAFKRELAPFIRNLESASGLIECRQADRMTNRFIEENEEIVEFSGDDDFETMSYRSCHIAHDKAKVLYIAHGFNWDKSIADFCHWAMQYDLWVKFHLFGFRMREIVKSQKFQTVSGPQNMLDLVPDRFSLEDLKAVHHAQGREGDVKQLIYTWVNRGHIIPDTTTGEYIKTENYLSKHSSNNT